MRVEPSTTVVLITTDVKGVEETLGVVVGVVLVDVGSSEEDVASSVDEGVGVELDESGELLLLGIEEDGGEVDDGEEEGGVVDAGVDEGAADEVGVVEDDAAAEDDGVVVVSPPTPTEALKPPVTIDIIPPSKPPSLLDS